MNSARKTRRTGPVSRRRRIVKRLVRWLVLVPVGGALLVALVTSLAGLAAAPALTLPAAPDPRPVVNDVTRLNPIAVSGVVAPRTTDEVAAAVRGSTGPIAIGGGRFSMGGQTATPDGLQLDLRALRGVLAFDPRAKTITVRAGTRWREVQETIDPAGLAVKIMQTYNTFTVGGALSVNAHGRYVGLGPVAQSVRAIRVVLADGRVVTASRAENPELFWGALGGYGGLGVITEVTLDLADNVPVRRDDVPMPLAEFPAYFRDHVRANPRVIFANADIYPDAYERVRVVTYAATSQPVTEPARLRPADQASRVHRTGYAVVSGPGGAWIREHLVDPVLLAGNPVTWRNFEASYDVSELEPASRDRETYVLQEFFAPAESLAAFVPRMGRVLRAHRANAVNVSIRHATADPGTLLAWAPGREHFALVLYYKQGTTPEARRAVGRWTRELIDSALAAGGRYYLPYQPHATRAQFARAYPRAAEYFALKRRVDPAGRFTNTLWDLYAPGPDGAPPPVTAARLPAALPAEARMALDARAGYARDEASEWLTHPEWDLVYSSEGYADWLRAGKRPSAFPYAASVGTFWRSYGATWRAARRAHPVPLGTHVMLAVIGTSTAAEYGLKAVYENTLGRLGELAMPAGGTAEDRYAAAVAADYARLIRTRGWYEFDFGGALARLWGDVPATGPGMGRKWERRLALSMEYGFKAAYAALIGLGTGAAYAPDDTTRYLAAAGWNDAIAARVAATSPGGAAIRQVATLDRGLALLAVPRYDPYRDALLALARHADAVRLAEVSGADVVTFTGVAPRGWRAPAGATPVVAYAVPTDPARVRVLLAVRARDLLDVLGAVQREGRIVVDHVYDY